jgi:hypothetical protein
MQLAFGVHVGRFFFEKVHEGIFKIADGFDAAQKAGIGFTESLMDAARAAFGVATAVERLNENMKLIRRGEAAFGKGVSAATSKDAAAAYKEAFGDFSQAYQAANNDRGPSASVMENVIRGIFGVWQPESAATDIRWRGLVANDARRRLGVAYDAYIATRGIPDAQRETMNAVNGFLFQGLGTSGPYNTIGLLSSGLQKFGGSIGSFFDAAWSPFAALPGAFTAAVGGRSQRVERERLTEELRVERLRLTEGQKALNKRIEETQSVGAENSRFLTRGFGPLQSPELAEAQKTNASLEAIKDKIKDLETQLKNFDVFGVANKL